MPTRSETAELARRLFEEASYPAGLSPETAWLGVYEVLLWYEVVSEGVKLPHIMSADTLRPTQGGTRKPGGKWVERARKVNAFLAEELGCGAGEVPELVDRLMRMPDYRHLQRHNPLGIAFAELLAYILKKFGASGMEYRTEVPAEELFPGVKLQSRSKHPRIDVTVLRGKVPVALVTTKWSVRHDRLTDVIDESISYRTAAMRLGLRLPCIFVTNEFDPARLDKVISSEVLECVVHVCPRMVTDICGLDGRMSELKGLPYLVEQTHRWQAS